jgi:hypothetical protein
MKYTSLSFQGKKLTKSLPRKYLFTGYELISNTNLTMLI